MYTDVIFAWLIVLLPVAFLCGLYKLGAYHSKRSEMKAKPQPKTKNKITRIFEKTPTHSIFNPYPSMKSEEYAIKKARDAILSNTTTSIPFIDTSIHDKMYEVLMKTYIADIIDIKGSKKLLRELHKNKHGDKAYKRSQFYKNCDRSCLSTVGDVIDMIKE